MTRKKNYFNIFNIHYLDDICKSIVSNKFDNSVEGIQDVRHGLSTIFLQVRLIANSYKLDYSLMFDKLVSNKIEICLVQKTIVLGFINKWHPSEVRGNFCDNSIKAKLWLNLIGWRNIFLIEKISYFNITKQKLIISFISTKNKIINKNISERIKNADWSDLVIIGSCR